MSFSINKKNIHRIDFELHHFLVENAYIFDQFR